MKEIKLKAADGYTLSGSFFKSENAKKTVLIAGATGVPQGFYFKFANYLNALGLNVVTFDYRGICESAPNTLKGFQADFIDWAKLDLQTYYDFSIKSFPTILVGHSFGGHAFGLLENANESLGLIALGTGAGWHGHMPTKEKYRVQLLWNVVAPTLVSIYGFLPMSKLKMGEDLPKGVYKQWKYWCQFPNYWFDDPCFEFKDKFSQIKKDIFVMNSEDDLWAPPKSSRHFFSGYKNANVIYQNLNFNNPIGHMGYFRESNKNFVWNLLSNNIQYLIKNEIKLI